MNLRLDPFFEQMLPQSIAAWMTDGEYVKDGVVGGVAVRQTQTL